MRDVLYFAACLVTSLMAVGTFTLLAAWAEPSFLGELVLMGILVYLFGHVGSRIAVRLILRR